MRLEWLNCSEINLADKLKELDSAWFSAGTIFFLEGPMGAGKSAFARAVLSKLAPEQLSKGSPTFPIVQEYVGFDGASIYHIDLYRIKDESELVDSGIEELISDVNAIVLIEWGSLFESYFDYWLNPAKETRQQVIQVQITLAENESRNYRFNLIKRFQS